jgi:hypothetical protein
MKQIDEKVFSTLKGTLIGQILELMTNEKVVVCNDPAKKGEEVVTELLPWEIACYTLFSQKAEQYNQMAKEMADDEPTSDEYKLIHYQCEALVELFWGSLRGREVKLADAEEIGVREGNKVVIVPPQQPLGVSQLPGFGVFIQIVR